MITLGNGQIALGDCLDVMRSVPSASVDMILCDLPYGTTACSWDSVIPFEPLWSEYLRVIKGFGAVVLFGAEPFSSMVRMSNIEMFKYDWVWHKSKALGFTNAKNKPMNKHEIASVFSKGTVANKSEKRMPYFPQDLIPYGKTVKGKKGSLADGLNGGHRFGRPGQKETFVQEFTNYPTSVIEFSNEGNTFHPTQKPVALFEYLIRTYTNEGDVVMDNCIGSGTTAIAAENTGRRWIGIERDPGYFGAACERIARAVNERNR